MQLSAETRKPRHYEILIKQRTSTIAHIGIDKLMVMLDDDNYSDKEMLLLHQQKAPHTVRYEPLKSLSSMELEKYNAGQRRVIGQLQDAEFLETFKGLANNRNDEAHTCTVEELDALLAVAPPHIPSSIIYTLKTFQTFLTQPLRQGERLRDDWLLRNRNARKGGRSK
ncbi:unnamed protein product [Sympodiomycopsis kandeliae]